MQNIKPYGLSDADASELYDIYDKVMSIHDKTLREGGVQDDNQKMFEEAELMHKLLVDCPTIEDKKSNSINSIDLYCSEDEIIQLPDGKPEAPPNCYYEEPLEDCLVKKGYTRISEEEYFHIQSESPFDPLTDWKFYDGRCLWFLFKYDNQLRALLVVNRFQWFILD